MDVCKKKRCCEPLKPVNFDTEQAVSSNKIVPAYFATCSFERVTGIQCQSVTTDGTYMYVSFCDYQDKNGFIGKFDMAGNHLYDSNIIENIGHAKMVYNKADNTLIIAQRKLESDWGARGLIKVDAYTLEEIDRVESKNIVAFVQHDFNIYMVNSSQTEFRKVNKIDWLTGEIDYDLVTLIPNFEITKLVDDSNVQCYAFDGRTLMCIRNNPQCALLYDLVTKKITFSHIGDTADYRNIGELEGCFTLNGNTVFISSNDTYIKPFSETFTGLNLLSMRFWQYSIKNGGIGSRNPRENVHALYKVNPLSIYVGTKLTAYEDGSQEHPFATLQDAVEYYKNTGNAQQIMISEEIATVIQKLRCNNVNVNIKTNNSIGSVIIVGYNNRIKLESTALSSSELYSSILIADTSSAISNSKLNNTIFKTDGSVNNCTLEHCTKLVSN